MAASLNERERQVLEAVIETYVETAEPAGSRTVSKRFGLDLSPASIRNTMSDLEEKGYLYHPHTRSEEHTSELQSRPHLVCRLLLEKKKKETQTRTTPHTSSC